MRKLLWLVAVVLGTTACAPQTAVSEQERIIQNIARTSFPERVWVITPTAEEALTVLQQAIDSCSWSGGGVVRVEAGDYALNGPLHLKSNVNLHLANRCVSPWCVTRNGLFWMFIKTFE